MSDGSSTTLRAFVAIEIGDTVRAALTAETADLRRRWPRVKWVADSHVHLTLAFLGHIYPEQAEVIGSDLVALARETPPFELSAVGLGGFGPPRSPRVVWVGVAGDVAALRAVQSQLAGALRQRGLTPEDRPFSPHLTLGRVKASGDAIGLGDWLKKQGDRSFGRIAATSIALKRSELLPAGPVYTTLVSCDFKGR